MILHLRTLPRSDGQTSVVLTREPAVPADPEIVAVTDTSREAVEWILTQVPSLTAQAGKGFVQYEGHYRIQANGRASASVTLELRLGPGEHLVVR